MKRVPIILITAAILISGCGNKGSKSRQEASQDSTNAMSESMDDISKGSIDFATSAAGSNMKEIALGQLALKNADNERLKQFGQKMIETHTMSNKDLQTACYTAGVTLPSGLSADDQEEINEMAGKKGVDFDRSYVKKMLSEHRETVKRLDAAVANLKDSALQNYAKKTLPVVKSHLAEARSILELVRKDNDPAQFDDVDSYQ